MDEIHNYKLYNYYGAYANNIPKNLRITPKMEDYGTMMINKLKHKRNNKKK